MNRTTAISKILSRNDSGENGAHQSGILIPKAKEILSFFPPLDNKSKNPRHLITFTDNYGNKWTFSFIYYNNLFFDGTRNEYRLTCMTSFIRSYYLKQGDEILLCRDDNGFYSISYKKDRKSYINAEGKLILGNSWVVVKI